MFSSNWVKVALLEKKKTQRPFLQAKVKGTVVLQCVWLDAGHALLPVKFRRAGNSLCPLADLALCLNLRSLVCFLRKFSGLGGSVRDSPIVWCPWRPSRASARTILDS